MKRLLLLCAVLCALITSPTLGSHITGLDLTYSCVSGDTYLIKLKFYRDCKGISAPSSVVVAVTSASCSQSLSATLTLSAPSREVSSVCAAQLSNTACNGGPLPGIQEYIYTGTITLPQKCADWVISYDDCCRNSAITNLLSPGSQGVYTETRLNNLSFTCNNSPEFYNLPVPYICNGQPFTFNHGAVDIDGDSLVYRFIPARSAAKSNIGYQAGYTFNNPMSTSVPISLNAQTGEVKFTPDKIQQSVMVIEVLEYRNGIRIGSVMRDMQVIVVTCTNNQPSLDPLSNLTGGISPSNFYVEVCAGQTVAFTLTGVDADAAQIVTMMTNLAAAIPAATITPVVGTNPVTANFSWATTTADLGLNVFTVEVRDNACAVYGFQTFTISINVLKGTTAGSDKYYCTSGGPIPLTVSGGTVFNWTLVGGAPATNLSCTNCPSPLASPPVTTTYVVESNFGFGCTNKDTITVHAVSSFPLTMSPDTNSCDAGKGMQIGAFPGGNPADYTYSWTPTTGLSDPVSQTPTVVTLSKTSYICVVTSVTGCSRQDTVTIDAKGQLDLHIIPGNTATTCSQLELGVLLIPSGYIFQETFHEEVDSSNWTIISGGQVSNTCGAFHHDSYYFNQAGSRDLTSKILDVHKGGVITFYLRTGTCRNCTCDKPENDDQLEDLVFEYTTDGTNWTILNTYDADVYSTQNFFSPITIPIPDAAKTLTTQFRWRQLNHNGLNRDIWMIDEIFISEGLGTYTYEWTPDNTLSDGTISNPTAYPDTTTTYTVHIFDAESGCYYDDTIKVVVDTTMKLIASNVLNYCVGADSAQFSVQLTPQNINYVYSWSPSSYLSAANILNPKVLPPSTTNYVLTVIDTVNHCAKRSNVMVFVRDNFTLSVGADSSACRNSPHMLEAITDPVTGPYAYQWTPKAKLSDDTIRNPILTTNATGTYIAVVQDTITSCVQRDTLKIEIFPDFNFSLEDSLTFCPDQDSIKLEAIASPGNGYVYQWFDGTNWVTQDSVQYLHNQIDTIIYVQVHQPDGCWKRDSIVISTYGGSGVSVSVTGDQLIHQDDPAVLTAVGVGDDVHYIWRPKNLVDDYDAAQVTSYPWQDTTYTVIAYDDCYADTAYIRVAVIPFKFFIPNLVLKGSPTENRMFKIADFGTRWNAEIYNRWGQIVYKKDQYLNEWNVNDTEDGMYYYLIIDTVTGKEYKGWVQLMSTGLE